MSKWIAEFELEDGDTMPEHMDLNYKGIKIDFHCKPLPKGHWRITHDYLTTAYGSVDYVKCSCCGEDSLEEGNYCPNCGTKMEEVEENDD